MSNNYTLHNRTLPQGNVPPSGSKGYLWIIVLLLVAALYLVRVALGTISYGFLSGIENTFRFSDGLPPLFSWVLAGLLMGTVCGAAIAARKYHLEKKYVLIPAGVALVIVIGCAAFNKPFTALTPYPNPVTATISSPEPAATDTAVTPLPGKPRAEKLAAVDTIPPPASTDLTDTKTAEDTVITDTATDTEPLQ